MTQLPSIKTSVGQFATLVFALTLLTVTASQVPAQSNDAQWFRSLEQAQQHAKQSGRPLFVVFRCER